MRYPRTTSPRPDRRSTRRTGLAPGTTAASSTPTTRRLPRREEQAPQGRVRRLGHPPQHRHARPRGRRPAPLIRAVSIAPAGTKKAAPGLSVIDRLIAAGCPLTTVLVDRGYTYLRPEDWAIPVGQRGIEQVFDPPPDTTRNPARTDARHRLPRWRPVHRQHPEISAGPPGPFPRAERGRSRPAVRPVRRTRAIRLLDAGSARPRPRNAAIPRTRAGAAGPVSEPFPVDAAQTGRQADHALHTRRHAPAAAPSPADPTTTSRSGNDRFTEPPRGRRPTADEAPSNRVTRT